MSPEKAGGQTCLLILKKRQIKAVRRFESKARKQRRIKKGNLSKMESATRLHQNRTERCLLTVHLIQTQSGIWRRERQRLQISPRGRGSDSGDARPRSFRERRSQSWRMRGFPLSLRAASGWTNSVISQAEASPIGEWVWIWVRRSVVSRWMICQGKSMNCNELGLYF